MSNFSFEGYQILWYKRTRISRRIRRLIKKSLVEKSVTIEKLMELTKQEALNNQAAEIRFHLAPNSNQKFYLTIEAGANAWHLILETDKACIGEIVREGGKFIRMLNDKDVEVETF